MKKVRKFFWCALFERQQYFESSTKWNWLLKRKKNKILIDIGLVTKKREIYMRIGIELAPSSLTQSNDPIRKFDLANICDLF